MAIELAPLPYDLDSLIPHMSQETLEFHYGKHHQNYVEKTNELIRGSEYDKMELTEILLKTYKVEKKIFNNAAQAWNHDFFWKCLGPAKAHNPSEELTTLIEGSFHSLDNFVAQFTKKANEFFGSGWIWLVKNKESSLSIVSGRNADNPLTKDLYPLLTCDVWEHAYYIDYRNQRAQYVDGFWKLVNWEFVESNLDLAAEFYKQNHGPKKPAPHIHA